MKTFSIQVLIGNHIRLLFFKFEEIFRNKNLRLPNYPGYGFNYLQNVVSWTNQSIEFLSTITSEDFTTIEFFKNQIASIKDAAEESMKLEK